MWINPNKHRQQRIVDPFWVITRGIKCLFLIHKASLPSETSYIVQRTLFMHYCSVVCHLLPVNETPRLLSPITVDLKWGVEGCDEASFSLWNLSDWNPNQFILRWIISAWYHTNCAPEVRRRRMRMASRRCCFDLIGGIAFGNQAK